MKKFTKVVLIILSIIFILALTVFCFLFVGKARIQEDITWGVDFSQMQAESLGLDWKELYSAMINDLKTKNIKLHTQWDWTEGQKDNYYFEDIDWQIEQAEKNNVNIIYVVGVKTGRWPECHIPGWTNSLSEKQTKERALEYIKKVILRYKNSNAIAYWQVENEPLFKFGECPDWYYKNSDFLKIEVELVKSLDSSRQVIVSDTGEYSFWFKAAKIGDIVGTTMYRKAWAHISDSFGFYFNYLFSPVYYSRKALLVQKIFSKKVICIELQAEPWASEPFNNISVEQQYKTMDPQTFKENVRYAKETGFDTFYFWGVEWWYWLKTTQNQPQIWNEASNLFKS